MKLRIITILTIALISTPILCDADSAIITLNASSSVTTDYIMLGSIATIVPSPLTNKDSAKLAATIVGRAPLPGLSRPLTRGDIKLKLRANDIDPTGIDFEGPTDITVTSGSSNSAGSTSISNTAAAVNGQPAVPTKAIKVNDAVDVMVIDGPVIVHARGYANQDGVVGDLIQVRRDGIDHLLTCQVIGAGQTQLEE